jgi:hypothetical protein
MYLIFAICFLILAIYIYTDNHKKINEQNYIDNIKYMEYIRYMENLKQIENMKLMENMKLLNESINIINQQQEMLTE